jgi:hypothetical protein
MIRIDLTTLAVTVEGDGSLDSIVTVRTLQTPGSSSRVARWDEEAGLIQTPLDEIARSRQGQNLLLEYDIDQAGVYTLTSGRRELQQNRTFFVRVAFPNREAMTITVLPGSAECPWVVEDELHNYTSGETFQFFVRVAAHGVPVADGEITRMESDKTGVKFERATAWERLMEDDDTDSV